MGQGRHASLGEYDVVVGDCAPPRRHCAAWRFRKWPCGWTSCANQSLTLAGNGCEHSMARPWTAFPLPENDGVQEFKPTYGTNSAVINTPLTALKTTTRSTGLQPRMVIGKLSAFHTPWSRTDPLTAAVVGENRVACPPRRRGRVSPSNAWRHAGAPSARTSPRECSTHPSPRSTSFPERVGWGLGLARTMGAESTHLRAGGNASTTHSPTNNRKAWREASSPQIPPHFLRSSDASLVRRGDAPGRFGWAGRPQYRAARLLAG